MFSEVDIACNSDFSQKNLNSISFFFWEDF